MLLRSGNKVIETNYFDTFEFNEGKISSSGKDTAKLIMRCFPPEANSQTLDGPEARRAWKAICDNSIRIDEPGKIRKKIR